MARIHYLVPRDNMGRFRSADDVNYHRSASERGDACAAACGVSTRITPDMAAAWGIPYVNESRKGRGLRMGDGVIDAVDGRRLPSPVMVSFKSTGRPVLTDCTSVVITTPSADSIPSTLARIAAGFPVVVVHMNHDGTMTEWRGRQVPCITGYWVDRDAMTYQVFNVNERLRAQGGSIPDRTNAGRPGRGGSGHIWGKWVTRKEQEGIYFEVSAHINKSDWTVGTAEEMIRTAAAKW